MSSNLSILFGPDGQPTDDYVTIGAAELSFDPLGQLVVAQHQQPLAAVIESGRLILEVDGAPLLLRAAQLPDQIVAFVAETRDRFAGGVSWPPYHDLEVWLAREHPSWLASLGLDLDGELVSWGSRNNGPDYVTTRTTYGEFDWPLPAAVTPEVWNSLARDGRREAGLWFAWATREIQHLYAGDDWLEQVRCHWPESLGQLANPRVPSRIG